MALLDISEYPRPSSGINLPLLVGSEPALAYQQVTFTGTAAASNAFGATTRVIRVSADSICRIKISTAGTAVTATTGMRLSLGVAEYFNVAPGDKISAIVATP